MHHNKKLKHVPKIHVNDKWDQGNNKKVVWSNPIFDIKKGPSLKAWLGLGCEHKRFESTPTEVF